MSETPTEVQVSTSRDDNLLEGVFKVIWEKTRAAADLINQLRLERGGLTQRVAELQSEIQKLRTSMAAQDQEFRRLKAEHAQLMSSNGSNILSGDEKERLKGKIRDLIAKINSYL